MAEYALRHPMVWFVHFPFTPPGADERVVEEGIILNVKYSLRAGNALVIYCPRMDVIVELPLKTIIRKVKKVDVTPFQEMIMKSFDRNKDLISTNTKRLLRVSLSISDEKITAARNAKLETRREGSFSESDEEDDDESEEDEESESDEDSESGEDEEEEDDECLDFKVHILSSKGSEVRGECLLRTVSPALCSSTWRRHCHVNATLLCCVVCAVRCVRRVLRCQVQGYQASDEYLEE